MSTKASKVSSKQMTIPRNFTHVRTLYSIAEYQHKNGLQVLFVHEPHTESVTVNVVYRVGSRHEPRGKTGMAHMLEHMLFKETYGPSGKPEPSYHTVLENKGAFSNATTWDDRTHYYFTMPAEYLEEILTFEATRMRRIVLTDKTFKPEQQNVLSEYEMYADKPEFILGSALVNAAFVSHGYGHDTIGHKPDIAALTCADLKEFYDRYYSPRNTTVVVVGDVTGDRTLAAIDKTFGTIQNPAHSDERPIVEPPLSGERRIALTKEGPVSLFTYAVRAPSARDADWAPLFVALTHLTDGRLSPLYRALIDTQICSSLLGTLFLSHDPHILTIQTTVSHGHTHAEVERIIRDAIKSLVRKPLSAATLARIKEKIIADTLLSRDGTNAIARELTEYIAAGDWTLYYTLMDQFRTVTPEEVTRAARTWLTLENALIGTLTGTPTTSS